MLIRHLPNVLTGARLVLAVPIGWLILEQRFAGALVLFFVAGFSDALDGFIAKRYGYQSWIGGVLDPIADKTLIVVCFLALGSVGVVPLWLVLLVIVRDLVIVAGAASYYFLVERFEPEPTLVSKLNTLLLLVLVLGALVDRGLVTLPSPVLQVLAYGAAVTTVVSGLGYVWDWSARARRQGFSRDGQ